MISKKREKKSRVNTNLLLVLVVGIFFVISFIGIAMGANTGIQKYFGKSVTSNIDEVDITSYTNLIGQSGVSSFMEIWKASTPEERSRFTAALPIGEVEQAKRNLFYKALLKDKYKEIQEVDLGNMKIDMDASMENLIVKADGTKEFKLPISPAKKVRLVTVKADGENLKLAYDPMQTGKSENYRTLTITSGFEGSINPDTGAYVDKDGKATNIFLLHGQGGEISLAMKDGKPSFGIGKVDISKLTAEQKAKYDFSGTMGLTDTAIVKIGDNYYYGSSLGDSSFEVDGTRVNLMNGEIAASDGKATLAYIRNSGDAFFDSSKSAKSSSEVMDVPFGDKEIKLVTTSDGKNNLITGKGVSAGIKLFSDFENVYFANEDQSQYFAPNGHEIAHITDSDLSVPADGDPMYTPQGGDVIEGGQRWECNGAGCRLVPGQPVRNVLRLGAAGVAGIGRVIANRPVISFFRERQPVRNFFREVQPVRRLGGAAIRGVGAIGRGAIIGGGRVGGGVLRAGGGALRGAGRVIAFPFRRW